MTRHILTITATVDGEDLARFLADDPDLHGSIRARLSEVFGDGGAVLTTVDVTAVDTVPAEHADDRTYVVGLPVAITVHADGTVSTDVDYGDAAHEIRRGEGNGDVDDATAAADAELIEHALTS